MINMANEELSNRKGDIIFINDRDKYRVKVDRRIRFIDLENFYISSDQLLFGFINGLIAENYDLDVIYIDNLMRIIQINDVKDTSDFFKALKQLDEKFDIEFVLSLSCEKDELPEEYLDLLIQ
jgi:archaellum biogenesis ATPase FlaH